MGHMWEGYERQKDPQEILSHSSLSNRLGFCEPPPRWLASGSSASVCGVRLSYWCRTLDADREAACRPGP